MLKWLFSFVFFLTACSSNSSREEIGLLHLQIGTAHLSNGKYPQALKELLIAESYAPRNALIQNNLGLAYFVRGKIELAEKHLRKAIDIDGKFSDARNNLGRILYEKKRYKEANEEIQKVLQDLTYTNPEKANFNMGLIQFATGNYSDASESFLKTLEVMRDNCDAHNYYGRSLYEMKKYNKAAAALDRAVLFCKKIQNDEPHYYSALSYLKLGQKAKSRARLEEIIGGYPEGKYQEKSKELLDLMR